MSLHTGFTYVKKSIKKMTKCALVRKFFCPVQFTDSLYFLPKLVTHIFTQDKSYPSRTDSPYFPPGTGKLYFCPSKTYIFHPVLTAHIIRLVLVVYIVTPKIKFFDKNPGSNNHFLYILLLNLVNVWNELKKFGACGACESTRGPKSPDTKKKKKIGVKFMPDFLYARFGCIMDFFFLFAFFLYYLWGILYNYVSGIMHPFC